MEGTQFDLIVIGAGPGGYEAAAHCAGQGQRVLLIEKAHLGGTCLNSGCIPTKCLCASAEMISLAGHAKDFGIDLTLNGADYGAAVQRKNGVVESLREDVARVVSGCTVIHGEASVLPDGQIRVGEDSYTAPRVIIATGSRPAVLPVPGAELAIDSTAALEMTSLPASMVIVGAGVIGMEMASVFSTYGVNVTVIEYCKEILPPFDAEVAKRLRSMLSRRGVKFEMGASVEALTQLPDRRIAVTFTNKKGEHTIEADQVLCAVGRRPVLPDGLADAGITLTPRGFIEVNADMETTRPGFYAVGDCNGLNMLAHVATAQAMHVIGQDVNLSVVPAAVFTHPEVAAVGLTENGCTDQGKEYIVKKSMYASSGKARANGETDGFVKVLVEKGTDRILGAHIIGAHASDLIQPIAVAMANGLTATQAGAHTIYPHPTLVELVHNAL